MSTAPDLCGRGPYTIEDLDMLPEEGKRFELVHGWLIPMSPGIRHDESAELLKEILGIPSYWIVDLQPQPSVSVLQANRNGGYREISWVVAGDSLRVDQPVAITFDPARLLPDA